MCMRLVRRVEVATSVMIEACQQSEHSCWFSNVVNVNRTVSRCHATLSATVFPNMTRIYPRLQRKLSRFPLTTLELKWSRNMNRCISPSLSLSRTYIYIYYTCITYRHICYPPPPKKKKKSKYTTYTYIYIYIRIYVYTHMSIPTARARHLPCQASSAPWPSLPAWASRPRAAFPSGAVRTRLDRGNRWEPGGFAGF